MRNVRVHACMKTFKMAYLQMERIQESFLADVAR